MPNNENYISRGYRNEVLKIILLSHLSRKEEYPYALFKVIQKRKVWFLRGVTKSDLYNALNSLEKHEYIKSKTIVRGTHARKNYTLTPEGKRIVKAWKMAMIKSFAEIVKMMSE